MLGKGLESLIPPKKNNPGDQGANSGSDQNTNQNPASNEPSRAPQPHVNNDEPREALPPPPHEDMLPSAPEPAAPLPMKAPDPAPAPMIMPVERPREEQQQPRREPVQPQSQPKTIAERNQTRPADEAVFHLEIEKIKPNPDQPRRNFNEEALRDMANSIREFGILQPIVVSKIGKETPNGIVVEYQIIAGERRYLAAKMLGLRFVPAIIRNVSLEREKLELAVIENIQRESLNPIETARAFQRLQEDFRMTQREIAVKLGKSREVVANTMRLLDLPEDIRVAVEKGELSETNARLLLAIEDPGAQKHLFEDILHKRLTTRDVKMRVEQHAGGRKRGRPPLEEANVPPEVRMLQDELSSSIGAPVHISKGVNTGRITITFYSEEELENILRRLGKEER